MLGGVKNKNAEKNSSRHHLPVNRILNVSINKHAVHFRMDVLNSDLKAVEKTSLRQLHFTTEAVYLLTRQLLSSLDNYMASTATAVKLTCSRMR